MPELLPPDGVPWPPEPPPPPPPSPGLDDVVRAAPDAQGSRRDIGDWRAMNNGPAPDGYVGNEAAAVRQRPSLSFGAVASLVLGVLSGILSLAGVTVPLAVPVAVIGVAVGANAFRSVRISGGALTGRPLAALGVGCGVVVLALIVVQVLDA